MNNRYRRRESSTVSGEVAVQGGGCRLYVGSSDVCAKLSTAESARGAGSNPSRLSEMCLRMLQDRGAPPGVVCIESSSRSRRSERV